jgi:hypothetical protein
MKLFVDYMNWKGIRNWREIVVTSPIYEGLYCEFNNHDVLINTKVMDVLMADRGLARRTLRVDHIYGFRVEA